MGISALQSYFDFTGFRASVTKRERFWPNLNRDMRRKAYLSLQSVLRTSACSYLDVNRAQSSIHSLPSFWECSTVGTRRKRALPCYLQRELHKSVRTVGAGHKVVTFAFFLPPSALPYFPHTPTTFSEMRNGAHLK